MEEITKKIKVNDALWIMECPKCKRIVASASERSIRKGYIN